MLYDSGLDDSGSTIRDAIERGFTRQLLRASGPDVEHTPTNCRPKRRVAPDIKRLFERLEILDAEHHDRGAAMLRHHDTPVLTFERLDHFGQPVLDIGQGEMFGRRHVHKYGHNCGLGQPEIGVLGAPGLTSRHAVCWHTCSAPR